MRNVTWVCDKCGVKIDNPKKLWQARILVTQPHLIKGKRGRPKKAVSDTDKPLDLCEKCLKVVRLLIRITDKK